MDATPERDEVLTFIRNSQRGIMKGYTGNILTIHFKNGINIRYKKRIVHCL